MKRPHPPLRAPEPETLLAFLDYYRELLIDKASGISDDQLHTRLDPSTLTLGGLINHMALVEDNWFVDKFAGKELPELWRSAPWDDDRDWEFNTAHQIATAELFERYRAAISRSNEIIGSVASLDQLSAKENRNGEKWSLRWILIHMIEETARHCGHGDLIRESIDGSVGDFRD